MNTSSALAPVSPIAAASTPAPVRPLHAVDPAHAAAPHVQLPGSSEPTAGAEPAATPSRWRAALVTIALVAYAVGYLTWTWWHWGLGDRELVSDAAPIPLALAAVVLTWAASRNPRVTERCRASWRFMSAASACWLLGECTWFVLEVLLDTRPFPSVADAGYLAFYPLMFAGLVRIPARRAERHERVALALDIAIVMVATIMVVWYLVIEPQVRISEHVNLSEVLSLAYPVGDVILMLGVARVLVHCTSLRSSRFLWLLTGGLALLAMADVAYARLELDGTYGAGTLPDALWVLALTGIALAAHTHRWTAPSETGDDAPTHGPRVNGLPYVALGVAFGLMVRETSGSWTGPVLALMVGCLGLVVLVVSRQVAVIRENERLLTVLDRYAHIDQLTGLSNRRHFFDVATRALRRSQAGVRPASAIMFDVDHFKAINDGHGHGVGDEVLEMVARRCQEVLRPNDLLGRYGGDEFVVLLPDADGATANEVARRLGNHVSATPFTTTGGEVAVTLSLGVSTSHDVESLATMVKSADDALYRAKQNGRNRFSEITD